MNQAVPEASLTALMHLLTEQALMALGVPHPLMKEVPPANPAVARFYVDLLGVLKEKTEGSRDDAETRQLEDLLYGLRMRLMDLKPAASAPAGPKP
ncbi:DUF1844 domain-containing protein [Geothrix oryzisoli]|uniref:DUF1844 domain-containing protein n=1 Tax=Geothrix oryzisoli TaxID=2922721 RepID=UPI0023DFCB3E|nr:DUF1844 domain-containing protein [Geothrix oryzisoli]